MTEKRRQFDEALIQSSVRVGTRHSTTKAPRSLETTGDGHFHKRNDCLSACKTAAEADATGEWRRDKQDREGQPSDPMTDEEREGKIDDLAEALRRAAGTAPSRDIQLLGDALHRAFGRHLKDAAEYLFTQPEDDEGGCHWSDPMDTNLGPEAPF